MTITINETCEREVAVPSFHAYPPSYMWIRSETDIVTVCVDGHLNESEINVRNGIGGFGVIVYNGKEITEQEFNEQLAIAQQRIAEVLQTKTTEVAL